MHGLVFGPTKGEVQRPPAGKRPRTENGNEGGPVIEYVAPVVANDGKNGMQIVFSAAQEKSREGDDGCGESGEREKVPNPGDEVPDSSAA
ncbi:unnamed protein product [Microthlaspi erraticum]|uniref:Uncharacterized protein n=1 Tax=Microthlaspi erraticum TaxID=1685480 RepID=A0A6D2KHF4_9BRAS|nr:unnamed protein product [Microthlaspi erraticum]